MDREIDNFDICIVGASIAGNYLCYLLSNTNLNIIVIEEHEQVGFPLQCAGIVSQKLSKLIDLPKEIVLNRVNIARIVAPGGRFIKLSGKEKPYIIDRTALDFFFYNKVRKRKNIQIYLGEKFKSYKRIKEKNQKLLLIQTSKQTFKVKVLVGCDGPLSPIAKSLNVKNKNLFATQIRISTNFDENEAVMYFNPRWKELFGWIVPEGNSIFRIGMACSYDLAKNFRFFLKKNKIDINDKIDQQGGLIPYGIMNKIAFNNILLLGDSGCQVKATTGGGIINLLTAAHYAADCIRTCIKTNNFSKKIIKKHYEKPCQLTIGKELKIHYLIRVILERLDNKGFKKLFEIIKSNKIGKIINIYGDMDFPKSFIFKFIKNPTVIFFLVRFILKNPDIFVELFRIVTK
ncbi:MAG: NAD(P)/FAD-dependent oxidoreductase [Candidatus Lokiarchaeota archaeon]|nr:NAD(P)/FAD-dependent oxidoreductase [Candidatus Lokiarchaeota archaeon]